MSVERFGQATADAAGTATVRITGSINASQTLELRSLTVQSTSALRCEARAYLGLVEPVRMRGGSRDGRLDTAAGEGERLSASDVLIVQWTGCTPGATCTASALFDVV